MEEEEDGFGSIDFFWGMNEVLEHPGPPKTPRKRKARTFHVLTQSCSTDDHVYNILSWLFLMLPKQIAMDCAMSFVFYFYGKRLLPKQPITSDKLSKDELAIYSHITKELSNPLKRRRIFDFLANASQRRITKRLINYFTVHYSSQHPEVAYYLNRETYPHTIIGEISNKNQPAIQEEINQGKNITWIQFHHEYKSNKNKEGRGHLHAPYARSVIVKGEDGIHYSLCELNFFIWFDDIGGPEIFEHFEKDVRLAKAQYESKSSKNVKKPRAKPIRQ